MKNRLSIINQNIYLYFLFAFYKVDGKNSNVLNLKKVASFVKLIFYIKDKLYIFF